MGVRAKLQHFGIAIRRTSYCHRLFANAIFDDIEFAEKELIGAQAAICPGIQVDQNSFADFVLRIAEDVKEAVAEVAAQLFENDAAFADLAFENLLNLQRDVGVQAVIPFVNRADNGDDLAAHNGACTDNHIVIGGDDNGRSLR